MKNIGLFYGSTTGNTEEASQIIQSEFGSDVCTLHNVSESAAADVEAYENLIFGASTWGIGDMQDDFEEFLSELENVDFTGKKVAIFGLGDQDSYADSFVDAIGTIYKLVQERGAEVLGKVSTDGYSFDESTAVEGDLFMGLPLDEENQGGETTTRIQSWTADLKNQFA